MHLAKHVDAEVPVAIKLARSELASQPGGATLFVQEINTWSSLVHPNVARVYTSGFHDGQPFLVMELLEGGSLRDEANRARHTAPSSALRLMLTIARAVQFAHRRGVIHCDLKPENILFDAEGNPRVSDFGLARRFTGNGSAPASVLGGTVGWMSPEQAVRESVMMASDVFSLGVMLYWLVQGEIPFGKETDPLDVYLERVREGLPAAKRRWSPDTRAALEVVWRRALALDPERRYPSAAAFADDLERIRDDIPLPEAATPLWGRAWHWSNRHPSARPLIPLLLAVAALSLFSLERDQAEKLERDALEANAQTASAQAIAVLFQLQQYGEIVRQAAEDTKVRDLLLPLSPKALAAAAEPPPLENRCSTQPPMLDPAPLAPYAGFFDTLVVLNTDGCMRARHGLEAPPPGIERRRFDWRDYFAGAREVAARGENTIHIRRVYQSSVTGRTKVGVSVPLLSGDQWIGVLAGSVSVASTLPLQRAETEHRMTVAIGLFEGSSDQTELPEAPAYSFIYHRKLSAGQKVAFPREDAQKLHALFGRRSAPRSLLEASRDPPELIHDYIDPLEGDAWLAAIAPIPSTGHFVVVQTRRSHALRASRRLGNLSLASGGLALFSGLALFLFWRWQVRRDQPPAARERAR